MEILPLALFALWSITEAAIVWRIAAARHYRRGYRDAVADITGTVTPETRR